MLIIFGGLPGTGKTSIAKSLARQLKSVYLRIDSMEQAFRADREDIGAVGYWAAYAVAADNLQIGLGVVADSVNPLAITRNAWRNIAIEVGVPFLEVELICSDLSQHRLRIESRTTDIAGLKLPQWQDVLNRVYEPWQGPHLIIDTATASVQEAVETIVQALPNVSN